jgi:integron integrase
LDRVREALRTRHYSRQTEKSYVAWIKRFVIFNDMRHPETMGANEVTRFLSNLATTLKVSASTQNQALSAILFLYKNVLKIEIGWLDQIVRAKRPLRLPVVLTRKEVAALLKHLTGVIWLVASLCYGAGLRLSECLRLRIKDLDFDRKALTVRNGKGQKDREVPLPESLIEFLKKHLRRVYVQHRRDLRMGNGSVEMPFALARKYPGAAKEWAWQWVFPATRSYTDSTSGEVRRHHLHKTVVQRAIKEAVRACGIKKQASVHTLRHAFSYCTTFHKLFITLEVLVGRGQFAEVCGPS